VIFSRIAFSAQLREPPFDRTPALGGDRRQEADPQGPAIRAGSY
jgi:hypothetical protein